MKGNIFYIMLGTVLAAFAIMLLTSSISEWNNNYKFSGYAEVSLNTALQLASEKSEDNVQVVTHSEDDRVYIPYDFLHDEPTYNEELQGEWDSLRGIIRWVGVVAGGIMLVIAFGFLVAGFTSEESW